MIVESCDRNDEPSGGDVECQRDSPVPVEDTVDSARRSPSMSKEADRRKSKDSTHSLTESLETVWASVKVDPLTCKVMIAGSMLAFIAGLINAIAFHALGAFVSHVTGTLSKTGIHAESGS